MTTLLRDAAPMPTRPALVEQLRAVVELLEGAPVLPWVLARVAGWLDERHERACDRWLQREAEQLARADGCDIRHDGGPCGTCVRDAMERIAGQEAQRRGVRREEGPCQ